MEIKKTPGADLEGKRTPRLLLGLVVALSCLFVALEYNSLPDDDEDMEGLEDFIRDAELMASLPVQEDMIPLPVEEEKPKTPEQLNLVDEVKEEQPEVTLERAPEVSSAQLNEGDPREELQPEAVDLDDKPLNFRVVEELPQFPGGAVELMKWLTKNLKYPYVAQQRKVQGRVVTQFIVNKDGSVSDLKIVESLDPVCDREALRVLSMMPHWKAGIQNDKPCRTMVCIPIVFRL